MTLALPGETPRQAIARLERLPAPEYVRVLESDEGQRLMEAVKREHRMARRALRRGEPQAAT